jgi:hypothetical protein
VPEEHVPEHNAAFDYWSGALEDLLDKARAEGIEIAVVVRENNPIDQSDRLYAFTNTTHVNAIGLLDYGRMAICTELVAAVRETDAS